jgi:hypothetical protein
MCRIVEQNILAIGVDELSINSKVWIWSSLD